MQGLSEDLCIDCLPYSICSLPGCCCCSVTKWYPTLCDPMDCSTPCLPVLHYPPSLLKLMPLNQWWHPTISSSVTPFSSCTQSFWASGSFPVSQFLASGGQSIGVSASASELPMNLGLHSFKIDWFDLLAVRGIFKSLLQHHILKASILQHSIFFMV